MLRVGGYSLAYGQRVKIKGREFTVGVGYPDGRTQFQATGNNDQILLSTAELAGHFVHAELEFLDDVLPAVYKKKPNTMQMDLTLLPRDEAEIVRRKLIYLDGILARNIQAFSREVYRQTIQEIATEVGDTTPPSPDTVFRWQRDWLRSDRDPRVLVQQVKRKGNRRHRLPREVREIIALMTRQFYLNPQRNNITKVFKEVESAISRDNEFRDLADRLPIPALRTIASHIKTLDPYLVMMTREGKREADKSFHAYGHAKPQQRVLQRVEIDSTVLDLFVLDAERSLVFGRPYITVAIDAYSRAIVGFHVGFTPPSYVTLMETIKHAVLPKHGLREKYPGLINEWECCGLMDLVAVDNGREYHSTHFADACQQLKIQVLYCPPREPWLKGKIERFFRTLNQKLLHTLPGTTFGKQLQLADYDPAKHASIDFEGLMEVLHIWIIDVYMQGEHRGIGMSPAQKWRESVNEFPPRWPASRRDLDINLGQIVERVIGKQGIEFKGLFYNSPELATLRHKLPPRQKIAIKYLPDDIGAIFARDTVSGDYLYVPALDQRYARGKTLWLHEIILRNAKENAKGRVDRAAILQAERAIQRVIDTALDKPNKRTNKHLARALNIKQQAPALDESRFTEPIRFDPLEELQIVEVGSRPSVDALPSSSTSLPRLPTSTALPEDESWAAEYSSGDPSAAGRR